MPLAGLYSEPPAPIAVRATVARAPANDAAGVYVTIDSWAGPDLWGPCTFAQKGTAKPTVGTKCLVVFDDARIPWVVGWAGQTV